VSEVLAHQRFGGGAVACGDGGEQRPVFAG
jgi:hypothetical protein